MKSVLVFLIENNIHNFEYVDYLYVYNFLKKTIPFSLAATRSLTSNKASVPCATPILILPNLIILSFGFNYKRKLQY